MSGCVQLNTPSSVSAQDFPAPRNLEGVVLQGAQYYKLSPKALKAEAGRLEKQYKELQTPERRAQLALFWALAPAPYGKRDQAINMMTPNRNRSNSIPKHYQPLIDLLLPILLDMRRKEFEQLATLQKLRDEQRRAKTSKQKNTVLQQKIDALMNVEKHILDRSTNEP